MGATLLQFRSDALNRLASHKGPQPSAPTTQTPPLPQQWAGYTPTPQSDYNYFQNAPVQGPTDPSQIRASAEAPVLAPPVAAPVSQPSYTPQATGKLSSSPIAAGKLSTSARGYASGGQVRSALPDNIRALAEETVKTGPVRGSMKDPKALRKAIMTAKSLASLVDPKFSRVPLPDIGTPAPEVYVPEHSPAMHEAFGVPMPKGYADGGEVGVLYRGTDPDSNERIQGGIGQGHLFATPHRDVAELYGSKISKMRLHPDAKVLVEGTPEFAAVTGRKRGPLLRTMRHGENLRDAANHAIASALENGYDAVEFNSMRDLGTAILNPSAVIHEDEPDHYASGGQVEDQNPFTQPNDLGFYSHAAATAAELPQERGTPEQFRGMLLNKGVKPAELEWSGFDPAFADQPQVTRQQIAEHFHENRPPVEEKRFQEGPTEAERKALQRKHLDEVAGYQQRARENPDFDPDGKFWERMQYWHQAEKRELGSKYDKPHHEMYTIPGGENYREILLKHGGEEGFKGVPVHFKGEPNVLTSLMVKDRQDAEGDKVLHLDELQSDWAQKGRKEGFKSPSRAAYQEYIDDLKPRFEAKFRQDREDQGGPAGGYENMEKVIRMYQGDAASMAHYLGEEDKHTALVNALSKDREGPHGRAPYVTKTEDWVDLGLKRALREAAEGGHDKLAWSPGKTIADRYDLAKHVGDIHHEKNDDGTYNLIVRGHDGETILKEDDWEPKKVADYFGKGVADRIIAGEGESGKEAYDRHFAARDKYNNFLDMAADKLAAADVEHLSGDDRERLHRNFKKIYKNGLERQPEKLLGEIGLLEDHNDLLWDLQDAEKALKEAPYYSPYRDWRRLSNLDLQVGEKWPFEMYDRMIPKRLLKLAKQHDPEAKLEKSVISHKADHDTYEFYPEDEYGNASDEPANPSSMTQTELHAIRITPKMRESILKKGFPAYAQGGEVEAYADGGEIDPELFKQYMKRIHSPWSDDPESVRKALSIAGSYRAPVGMETGVGSFYNIKQSMPASAVTRTIQDIPGVNLKPQKKGSWEDFYDLAKGNEFVNVGGDLSGFGRLTHINGKELAWPVDLHAGADYMREPNPGRVWANIGAHATGFQTKIREANERGKELYGILSPMGPSAVNSSHNMFDTLMAQIPNAEIDPDHLKEFDEAIKRGDHLNPKIKRNPKLFASYLKKLEKWPGLEDAKEVSEFARPWRGNLTGAHRADIVKFMDKGYWRDRGFPEVGVTRAAITNPDLLGAGGNKLGYRVVKLSSEPTKGDKSIFKHSTYPVDTFGEYVMDVPLVQRHYAQPDVIERLIKSPTKAGQIVHPYSEDPMGRSTARKLFEEQKQIQPVTQRFLDSVMTGMENQSKYGFKKGGSVRKALMIAKTTKKK